MLCTSVHIINFSPPIETSSLIHLSCNGAHPLHAWVPSAHPCSLPTPLIQTSNVMLCTSALYHKLFVISKSSYTPLTSWLIRLSHSLIQQSHSTLKLPHPPHSPHGSSDSLSLIQQSHSHTHFHIIPFLIIHLCMIHILIIHSCTSSSSTPHNNLPYHSLAHHPSPHNSTSPTTVYNCLLNTTDAADYLSSV